MVSMGVKVLPSPSFGSTAKSLTDHFFPLYCEWGLGGRFFLILFLGLEGGETTVDDGVGDGSVGCFLLKSVFKNRKNCFNRCFLFLG